MADYFEDVRYVKLRSGGPTETQCWYNTDYDFVFKLSEEIPNPRTMQVVQFFPPFTWYNVDAYNGTIAWNNGTNDLTATLTPGNYSKSTILIPLAAAMHAKDNNTYTVTFDSVTSKFTIAMSEADFTINWSASTINKLIGGLDSGTSSSTTKSLTCPVQACLQPVQTIDIRAPNIIHSTEMSQDKDLLYSWRVAETSGTYSNYMDSSEGTELKIIGSPKTMKEVTLRIVDQDGYSVDFQNLRRAEFFILLKIKYWRPKTLML